MSAVVVKIGGEIRLTDSELVDACGYHLVRIDHAIGGITLRVSELTPTPCDTCDARVRGAQIMHETSCPKLARNNT